MALPVPFPFGRLVNVFVTHVDESGGSFFVQVIDEDAEQLNLLMEEIEQSVSDGTSQVVKPNDISVGGIYLAEFEDDVWYRARVLGVSPSDARCELYFVDYGNSDFVPLQKIRKAKDQFLKLSPQAFECELHQFQKFKGNTLQEAMTSLKDKILEQELFCRAISLKKNGAIVVDLFRDAAARETVVDIAEAGSTSSPAALASQSSVRKDLKFKPVSVKIDSYQDVVVSHFDDPEHFCCQLISHTEDLQTLMSDLIDQYSELSSDTLALKSCSLGRACCAKFAEDGGWYRAIITGVGSVASGFVEVKFVDYGNCQKTPLTDVKEIKEELGELPAQAFDCTLFGVAPFEGQWSRDANALFGKLTKEKHMVGFLNGQEGDGRYQVKLYDTTSDSDLEIPDVLVATGYAKKTVESTSPNLQMKEPQVTGLKAQISTLPPPSSVFAFEKLKPGSSERILIPAAENPSKFYCQLFRTSQKLEDLMRDVAKHYSAIRGDEGNISSLAVGDPCCAKFSEDNCWYRAEVIDVNSSGKITVQFVDYGNSEAVAKSNIKHLLPQFSELPRQALECSLNRITPKSQAWSGSAIKKFYDLAVEKEGMIDVVAEESNGKYRVELTRQTKAGNVNISEQLVAVNAAAFLEGVMATTENLENVQKKEFTEPTIVVGNYEDVVVSHFEDPHNFWCQNLASSGDLDALMTAIDQHYSGSGQKDVVKSPFLGMSCIACYSVDNGWYRGKVTGIKRGNQVEVHFVDYGNQEVMPLSSVRDIKREFMQLPAQAFKCALESISFNEMQWPESVLDKFNELTSEKELVGRVDAYDKQKGCYLILLLDTSQGKNLSIGDEITALLPQNSQPVIEDLKLKPGDRETVFVTSVSGPSKLFCQVQQRAKELDDLMLAIDSHYQALDEHQSGVDQPVVGGFYVAKYSVDQTWFRAKVTRVINKSVEVYYVDYGNSENLPFSDLKQLMVKFAALPAQCVECSLAGDTEGISCEFFKEQTLDVEFEAKVVSVGNNGVPLIELFSQNTNESLLDKLPRSAEKSPVSAVTIPSVVVPSLDIQPNTKEDVYVTSVESVEKMFCQLSKNISQLDSLMDKMEEYYRPLDQQQETLASPSVNNFCVAKFSVDDGFYRAKISRIAGSNAQVCYIDYGNSEMVPLTDVKILKPEFAVLPAQAVCCSLVGCKSSADVNTKFQEIALEAEFDAKIASVHADNVQVELFTKESKVSVVTMLQTEVSVSEKSDSLKVMNLQIQPGTKEHALVTAFESPTKFYCQLTKNSEALDEMMNSVDEHYQNLTEGEGCIDDPSVGRFCVATFSGDGGWYRARITQTGSNISVFYIDYGNSESVSVKSIKSLHSKFTALPAQAIECCLKAEPTSMDIIDKEFEVQFLSVGSDGSMEVNLTSLETAKVEQPEPQSEPKAIKAAFKPLPGLFVNEYVDVCAVTVYGPHQFSCQVMSKNQVDLLRNLMDSIQTYYSDLSSTQDVIQSPIVGMPCCALFSDDGLWYRGVITSISSENTVDVTYIDYGNSDTVPLSDVRVLKEEFLSDPQQSISCSLASVKPFHGSSWSEESVARFETLVLQKQLVAKIVKRDGNAMEVELYDTSDENKDVNIGLQLVEEKFAQLQSGGPKSVVAESSKQSEPIKLSQLKTTIVNSSETVYVTTVVSPAKFYCQVEGIEEKLEAMMNDLATVYEALSPEDFTRSEWSSGDLCCTQFSEDGSWYRAVIEDILPEGVANIRFIDYGNGETKQLSELKELKEDFTKSPPFAIECCLSGAQPFDGKNWSSEAAGTFEQMTAEKALMASFVTHEPPYKVELVDGTVKLLEKLKENGLIMEQSRKHEGTAMLPTSSRSQSKAKKLDYSNPVLMVGDEKKALVTSIRTPGEFFCQLTERSTELDELMNDLNSSYSHLDGTESCLVSPVVGQPCVALFSEDCFWYRAKVTRLTVNSVEVQFVDYGNTEVIKPKDLKSIEPKYMTLPVQAIDCSLDLSKQDWTDEQRAMLENVTRERMDDGGEQEKEVSVKLMAQKADKYEVKVLDGTTCISDSVLAKTAEHQGGASSEKLKQSDNVVCGFSEVQLDIGADVEGYVSYTYSSQDFFIQLSDSFPRLCQLMDDMEAVYSSGDIDGLPVDSIKPGSTCVAKFAGDGGWYRALVKKYPSDTEVEVEFVDYGNSDTVQVNDVKPLKAEFANFPKQAVHCKLDTGKKTLGTDADELFKSLVEEKALTVVFTCSNSGLWNVILRDGSISISERLCDATAGEKPLTADPLLPNEFITMDIVEGQKEKVYISHVEHPGEFYIQFVSSAGTVDDLLEALSKEYHSLSANECPLSSFDAGMPCCVQYSVDGQWYRAVIEKVLDGKQEALVRFIDFGNSETVKTARIKELKKGYLSLPRQAICCSLGDPDEEWSSTAVVFFEEMANSEEEVSARFLTQNGKKWIVALEKNNVSVIDMLKSKDSDVREPITTTLELNYPQLAKGMTTEVYISHINSPNDFYIQISEAAKVLEEITNKIGEIYESLGPTDFMLENCDVGSVCCVKFSEDNCFYRAVVKRLLPDSQVEVEFVDYGNSDTVPLNLLKKLTPDIAKPPCQAVKCGLVDVKRDCKDKETSLIEALLDTPLQATFVEQEDEKWMVLLEHDGRCVSKAEELISTPHSETSVDIPVADEEREVASIDVKEGQTAEVFLVHTNDPSSFYIQFSKSSADIDTIMTEIESIYSNLGPSDESLTVAVNSLCCAKFDEDQQWYRAIVRKILPDSCVEVEFVDYGNTQGVALSSVKHLRQELRILPRQSIHCGMVDVEKLKWTEGDVSFFNNTLCDKPITASFVTQEDDKWLVKLVCEGICINTLDQFGINQSKPSAEHEVQQENQGFVEDKGSFSEAVLGTREPVYLLSTESDEKLWLQLSVTEKELEALMISISERGQFQKLDFPQLKEGLPCLGMFSEDDRWYRACIIEYSDERVHVRYVDYGNSEWISCDRLGVIQKEFLQLPVQAFHCKLQDVKKLDGDQLFELCDQKLLEVEVISRDPTGCYVVNLFDPECDKLINDLLIADNSKTLDDVITSVAVATDNDKNTFKKPNLKVGDELTLFVTVVDSPSSFWCQFGDEENQLETLMGQIHNFYSKLQDEEFQLESPTPGLWCCAQFTADDVWYRAVVQETVDDEKISVHFVDYGNDECLLRTRVKRLHEQFQSLPIQAVKCSLFGVEPSNGECWSNEANEKFHCLCSDKALSSKMVAIDGSVYEVELSDKEDVDQPSINSQLLSAELARIPSKDNNAEVKASSTNVLPNLVFKYLEICAESKVKVTVTSIVNPGEFWCQVTDSNDELFALMEELEKYYSSKGADLTGPSVGLPCCAKFEEDNQLYRAIITDVGASVKVRYVDYGNTATLPLCDIKFIDEQFLALPVQALLCCLHGASPNADGSWPADGTEYFQGLVLDQEMELTVITVENGKYVVTLTSAGGVDLGTAMSGEVPTGMLIEETSKSHEVSDEKLTAENSEKQMPTNTKSATDSEQQEVKKEIVIESAEQLQKSEEGTDLADASADVKSGEGASPTPEAESSESEEFVEAREDSPEEDTEITSPAEIALEQAAESLEGEGHGSGISISAEELKLDTKIDLGECQSEKCDINDKLLNGIRKLVEKDGSNSVNVESAALDEVDDNVENGSENDVLSDDALEMLNKELEIESNLVTLSKVQVCEDSLKKGTDKEILTNEEKLTFEEASNELAEQPSSQEGIDNSSKAGVLESVDISIEESTLPFEPQGTKNISKDLFQEQKESGEKTGKSFDPQSSASDSDSGIHKDYSGSGINKEHLSSAEEVESERSAEKQLTGDGNHIECEVKAAENENESNEKQPAGSELECTRELNVTDVNESKVVCEVANENDVTVVQTPQDEPVQKVDHKSPADEIISDTKGGTEEDLTEAVENIPEDSLTEATVDQEAVMISKEGTDKLIESEKQKLQKQPGSTSSENIKAVTAEQTQHTTAALEKGETKELQKSSGSNSLENVEAVTAEEMLHTTAALEGSETKELQKPSVSTCSESVEDITAEQTQHPTTALEEGETKELQKPQHTAAALKEGEVQELQETSGSTSSETTQAVPVEQTQHTAAALEEDEVQELQKTSESICSETVEAVTAEQMQQTAAALKEGEAQELQKTSESTCSETAQAVTAEQTQHTTVAPEEGEVQELQKSSESTCSETAQAITAEQMQHTTITLEEGEVQELRKTSESNCSETVEAVTAEQMQQTAAALKEGEVQELQKTSESTCSETVEAVTAEKTQHTAVALEEGEVQELQKPSESTCSETVEAVTAEQMQQTAAALKEGEVQELQKTSESTCAETVEAVTAEQMQQTSVALVKGEVQELQKTSESTCSETIGAVTVEQTQHTSFVVEEGEVQELQKPSESNCSETVKAVTVEQTQCTAAALAEGKDTMLSDVVAGEAPRPRDSPLSGDSNSVEDEAESYAMDEEKPAFNINGHVDDEEKDIEYEGTEQDPLLEDEVHITTVLGDGHFWSHFSSILDLAGLSELHEAMNRHYNKEEKEESAAALVDHKWNEGDLCAVYSVDENQWYRAEVAALGAQSTPTKKKPGFLSRLLTKKDQGAESSDGNCLVTLLDSGIQLTASLKALKPLDTSFQALPYQAKLCHLDDSCDLSQDIDRLQELLAHRTFRVNIATGVANLLACQDVPLILFTSKEGNSTTSCFAFSTCL